MAELEYHARLLDALQVDSRHKIILHVGGTYGDKSKSRQGFLQNFGRLPPSVATRLVIENDEKNYTFEDSLSIAKELDIPVVFDVFHHRWNPSLDGWTVVEAIEKAATTWGPKKDGRPKVHYSNQWPGRAPGSHSQSLDLPAFTEFYRSVEGMPLDVMLEVKDKEQSLLAARKALGLG